MNSKQASIYFPNLNGLRFLGALLVLLSHVEYMKECFGLPNLYGNPRFALIGKLGVHLFFVLSGFLITSLLLHEQQRTKNISIKKFYLRRILKIWPLYFVVVILGFFVLPQLELFQVPSLSKHVQENFGMKLFYNLSFLPNLAIVLYPFMPLSFQLWSIGLEEQYYLVIPWIMDKVKRKIFIFILLIIAYLIAKDHISESYAQNVQSSFWYKLHYFWYYFHIDSLAIGTISSLMYYRYKSVITKFFFNRFIEILSIALLVFFYYRLSIVSYYYQDEVYDIFFAIIILNAALNPNTLIRFENKWMNYLGKISYSTYMMHVIVLAFSFNILKHFGALNNLNIYLLSVLLTYVVSALTYELFEKKILVLKQKL